MIETQPQVQIPTSPRALSDLFTSSNSTFDNDDVVSIHSGSEFSYSDVSVESHHLVVEEQEEDDVVGHDHPGSSARSSSTSDGEEYDFVDTDEETEAEI